MRRLLFCSLLPVLLGAHAFAATLFSSGPYNGTVDGWVISDASPSLMAAPVADSFVLPENAIVTGFSFVVWGNPGATMSTVDWSILSAGSDGVPGSPVASGAAAVSQSLIFSSNVYGYDIDSESLSLAPGVALTAGGTYWLELQHGNDPHGDLFFWDENDNPNGIPDLMAWTGGIGPLTTANDPDDCPDGPCTETFTVTGTAAPEPIGTGFVGAALLLGAILRKRRVVN